MAGGFYPGGPMDLLAQAAGIAHWPAHPADPAMVVHLPGGSSVERRGGPDRRAIYRDAFGPGADRFWDWQERTADALWALALRGPAWPPQTPGDWVNLARNGWGWLSSPLDPDSPDRAGKSPLRLRTGDFGVRFPMLDAFRPVAAHLRDAPDRLRQFIDAQLLISAQTTSTRANALYGASALDLPRRGVVHLEGGIGTIAQTLVQAIRQHGGRVLTRQEVTRIVTEGGRPVAVETKRGESFPADLVIANLPPWNIARLLGESAPRRLRNLPPRPRDGWGAFVVYAGLDDAAVPGDFPLHHQVVVREPMAEGNTVFLSLSAAWDTGRAPQGRRALTLSTHADLAPWWELYEHDRAAYDARKEAYTARLLAAAEIALPGLRAAADLILPGTPVTFERFTRRAWGWVGGFPQTDLFRTWGPRLAPGLWMVGDSIFPGQSTAAVALGGMRAARMILAKRGAPGVIPAVEVAEKAETG